MFKFRMTIVAIAAALSLVRADGIALLTFAPEDVDSATAVTINDLFRESLEEFGLTPIKTVTPETPCRERVCAVAAAQSVNADEVIYCTARILGSKWIVRATRYRVDKEKPVSVQTLSCVSVEDFEPVMRRIAEAIVKGKSTEQVAAIDNITEKEADEKQFKRREGFYSAGFQFGYLYPYGTQSYNHWVYKDGDRVSQQYRQVLSTDFINWFEIPRNLSLQWDLHIGWGAEMGSHLILLKQFGRGDVSPYVGGGLGINYCFEGDPPEGVDENKRYSGFTLVGKGGVQFLRTYNFRVHLDGGYKYVFNDDPDQGPFLNLGIMWHKDHSRSEGSTQGSTNPLTRWQTIAGLISAILLINLVSSIAGN